MSGEPLSTMLAAPFKFTSVKTMTVTDDAHPAGHAVSFPADVTKYYRTFLADHTATAGTIDAPIELLANLQTALGAGWVVGLAVNGIAYIQYTGAVTNGAIVWGSSTEVEAQLGFTTNIAIAHSTNAKQSATYLPNHCAFAYYRGDDDGWRERMPRGAFARTGDGKVYGFTDGLSGMRRAFDLRAHPANAADRASLGMNATPAFDDRASWATPNAAVGVGPLGYSLRQFFQGVAALPELRIGATLGDFPALISGAQSDFDDYCLSVDAATGDAKTGVFIKTWSKLYSRHGIGLEWVAKMSL